MTNDLYDEYVYGPLGLEDDAACGECGDVYCDGYCYDDEYPYEEDEDYDCGYDDLDDPNI